MLPVITSNKNKMVKENCSSIHCNITWFGKHVGMRDNLCKCIWEQFRQIRIEEASTGTARRTPTPTHTSIHPPFISPSSAPQKMKQIVFVFFCNGITAWASAWTLWLFDLDYCLLVKIFRAWGFYQRPSEEHLANRPSLLAVPRILHLIADHI